MLFVPIHSDSNLKGLCTKFAQIRNKFEIPTDERVSLQTNQPAMVAATATTSD